MRCGYKTNINFNSTCIHAVSVGPSRVGSGRGSPAAAPAAPDLEQLSPLLLPPPPGRPTARPPRRRRIRSIAARHRCRDLHKARQIPKNHLISTRNFPYSQPHTNLMSLSTDDLWSYLTKFFITCSRLDYVNNKGFFEMDGFRRYEGRDCFFGCVSVRGLSLNRGPGFPGEGCPREKRVPAPSQLSYLGVSVASKKVRSKTTV